MGSFVRGFHRSRILALGLGLAALTGGVPSQAKAAPDDWSLERRGSDPVLVEQRFAKLRKRPFDTTQWTALSRSLGPRGLARKISSAFQRAPGSVNLAILEARAVWAAGDPATAADQLARIQARAGRFEAQTFRLRIDALMAAQRFTDAVTALEARAKNDSKHANDHLDRAFALANRGHLPQRAFELARSLANASPNDPDAALRLARAATAAGRGDIADRAYGRVLARPKVRNRTTLVGERAEARLRSDNASGAATLLWTLLESPSRGTKRERHRWWDRLLDAHRRDGSSEILAGRLARHLKTPGHAAEGAVWRTLAAAREATGANPIEAWMRAVARDAQDVESRSALVLALEDAGRIDDAVAEYRRHAGRTDADLQLGLDLANRLIEGGKRDLAFELAGEVQARAGRRAHPLLLVLDFYNLNEEAQKALAVAEQLVRSHPRDPEARVALGEQLYQMRRVDEALKQWVMLGKLVRPRHRGLTRHAGVLSEHGRTHEAVAVLNGALRMAPEEPEYHRLMAVLKEQQLRPDQALGHWQEVRRLATSPKQRVLRDEARTRVVEILVNGVRLKNRGRRLKIEVNRAERELDAGDPLAEALEAGRFLAELHTRQERYGSAVAVHERMLRLAPEDAGVLKGVAAAQRRAHRPRDAMKSLEKLLKLDGTRRAELLAELSELAFEAGDSDRALGTALRAIRSDPNQLSALLRLGELHERHGDLDEAAKAYNKALGLAPRDGRARLRLAELTLTRGDVETSARMFRELLEAGGPADLMRAAGRRALDLAQATESTGALVALAVERTRTEPEADEPREFLLETLERADPNEVERWLRRGKQGSQRDTGRVSTLRRPLVSALTRGSVGARLRAAEHLGRLGLPATAVPLATMGAKLQSPRDATRTVRDAFDRARSTALRAAGALDDPEAVPVFARLLEDPRQSTGTRRASAWALARNSSPDAVSHLANAVGRGDRWATALACTAIAASPDAPASRDVGKRVARLARELDEDVRHACQLAEAAVTPDHRVNRLVPQLESSDPMVAAIAAWRLGRVEQPTSDVVRPLLRAYLRPPGLARDSAGAALSRLLGTQTPSSSRRSIPPAAQGKSWKSVLRRWLHAEVAPRHQPIPPAALAAYRTDLAAAVADAEHGTRAERQIAKKVRCGKDGRDLCLGPLVQDPVRPGGRSD